MHVRKFGKAKTLYSTCRIPEPLEVSGPHCQHSITEVAPFTATFTCRHWLCSTTLGCCFTRLDVLTCKTTRPHSPEILKLGLKPSLKLKTIAQRSEATEGNIETKNLDQFMRPRATWTRRRLWRRKPYRIARAPGRRSMILRKSGAVGYGQIFQVHV